MIRSTCIVLITCTCLALGSLTGCGDDEGVDRSPSATQPAPSEDQASRPGPPLSRRSFVRRAGPICEKVRTRVDGLQSQHLASGDVTTAELGAFASGVALAVREAASEFRALSPPRRQRDEVAALVEAAEREAAKLEQTGTTEGQARKLLRGGERFAETERIARSLMLFGCVGIS